MRCRTCSYSLWNLSTNRCPECGSAFDVRTYRFKPATVAFACPHCNHLHPGTGDRYIPTTADQITCSNCRQPIFVAAMPVVLLVDDPIRAQAHTELVPWEERNTLGLWHAWWKTTLMGLFFPHRLGKSIWPPSNWPQSLRYALLTHYLGISLNILIIAGLGVFVIVLNAKQQKNTSHSFIWDQLSTFAIIIAAFLVFPLIILAFQLIASAVAHFMLKITGQKHARYKVTLDCFMYAQAPAVISLIPILGFCLHFYGLSTLWSLVSTIVALKHAQQISPWRAILAVILFPIILFASFLALTWFS